VVTNALSRRYTLLYILEDKVLRFYNIEELNKKDEDFQVVMVNS